MPSIKFSEEDTFEGSSNVGRSLLSQKKESRRSKLRSNMKRRAFPQRRGTQKVEVNLKQKVTKTVITFPAYLNEAQHQTTKAIAKVAGLEVLRNYHASIDVMSLASSAAFFAVC